MLEPVKVLIADDHPALREGLSALIGRRSDMTIVGEASNGKEAIEMFARQKPDVVLMDIQMPVIDGVEAIRTIRTEHPDARIIVLSTYFGDEDIYRALRAGASGYMLKDSTRDEILEAIRKVYRGGSLISGAAAAKLAGRLNRAELTSRELEVLGEMAKGKSNQEIGDALYVTQGTVKAHMNSILTKLDACDRTQALLIALRRGIIHIDKC